jgi:hypothetical protein
VAALPLPEGVENLTCPDIKQMISGTERTRVEVKEMLLPDRSLRKGELKKYKKEFASDCASFTNKGGYLLIGIRDEKKGGAIVGCTHGNKTIEAFLQAAHDMCKPYIDIEFKEITCDGRRIVAIYIPKNEENIVQINGIVFYRTGKGKRRATPQKIYSLELTRRAKEYKKQRAKREGLAGDYALLSSEQIKIRMTKDLINALKESGFINTRRRAQRQKGFFDFVTYKEINKVQRKFLFYVYPIGYKSRWALAASFHQRDSDFRNQANKHLPSGKVNLERSKREEAVLDDLRKTIICVIVLWEKASSTVLDAEYFSAMPVRQQLEEGKYLGIGLSRYRRSYWPNYIIDHTFIIEGCRSRADIDNRISLFSESVEKILMAAEG